MYFPLKYPIKIKHNCLYNKSRSKIYVFRCFNLIKYTNTLLNLRKKLIPQKGHFFRIFQKLGGRFLFYFCAEIEKYCIS